MSERAKYIPDTRVKRCIEESIRRGAIWCLSEYEQRTEFPGFVPTQADYFEASMLGKGMPEEESSADQIRRFAREIGAEAVGDLDGRRWAFRPIAPAKPGFLHLHQLREVSQRLPDPSAHPTDVIQVVLLREPLTLTREPSPADLPRRSAFEEVNFRRERAVAANGEAGWCWIYSGRVIV